MFPSTLAPSIACPIVTSVLFYLLRYLVDDIIDDRTSLAKAMLGYTILIFYLHAC